MPLLTALKLAAGKADRVTIEYGGGDPAELVALAQAVGAQAGCAVEWAADPDRPGALTLCFRRRAEADAPTQHAGSGSPLPQGVRSSDDAPA